MKNKIFLLLGCVVITVLIIALVMTYADLGKKENLIEQISTELDAKNEEASSLADELDYTKGENSKLLENLKAGGEFYEGRITELESQLAEKTELSDKLSLEMNKRKNQKGFDFSDVRKTLDGIEEYIENKAPLVRVMLTEEELENQKEELEDGDDIVDHDWIEPDKYIDEAKEKLGEDYDPEMTLSELLEKAESEAQAPFIAVYYEDIVSGYRYSYNGDMVFDAASVMKAPYITAVLEACTAYKNGEITPDAKDERYSAESLAQMFSLDKTVVLDEENTDVSGSGVLKDMPLGTEIEFAELFTYSLKNSDNIAFKIIKKNFTNKWYYDFVRKNGVKSPLTYEMNLTANEAGKLFKQVYYFTFENEEYGELVREALANSSHLVLSKNVLPNAIHKYGWDIDAYHDAAIVYGDRPYIAIVFTNIDVGGTKTDAYVREIFKKIQVLHNSLA